jgi:3',5'-nucleoside bisphosphate phosphatase
MRPLLCELHAYTTWSDGELSLGAVVDLYGTAGFDVLCVTDHVLRSDDPWPLRLGRPCLDGTNVGAYLAELECERARALSAYGLLLVPGLELTYNDPDPEAAHAVALGLRSLVAMDDRAVAAMETARAAGAAILVAHPHDFEPTAAVQSPTCYFARRIACGDLHRAEHLPGWKTLVPCEQDENALVDYLRSPRPVLLMRLEQATVALAA